MMAFLRVVVVATLLGLLAAVVGLAIENRNVEQHGVEYSSYQFDWLVLGALPGIFVTEARQGVDFQVGEHMLHQPAVIGWNSLVYGAVAAGTFFLIRFALGATNAKGSPEENSPNKSRHRTGDNVLP